MVAKNTPGSVATAKCCDQCNNAGKKIKPLLKKKQFGKISKSEKPNDEIALEFAGPFQNAEHGKKYLLVAIDNFSAWADALFLHKPTTKKVIEFLKNYTSQYGIPKQIRSDPGTAFTSEEFKTFCRNFQINNVTCPVRDHRGNGKIEELIRIINERLRTNKNIVLKKDKSGLSELLYALRMGKKADGKSPTLLPKNGKKEIVYSKRDVAKAKPQKKRTTPKPKDEQAGPSTRWNETEESLEDETYVASEETKDESTPTDTTITETVEDTAESEEERESRPEANETESEEIAVSQETATPQELPTHQETANPAENNISGNGKKKAVKASVLYPPQKEL